MKTRDCFKEGLLKKIQPNLDMSARSLSTANSFIKKAVSNFDDGNYDIAIVVAYTVMFHALRSILFRDGIKERSHVCLLIYIKEKYKDLESLVNDVDAYRRFRHTALYGLDQLATKDEAENAINVGKRCVSTIMTILKDK